eukprot:scaffold48379_cov55-Attheya_sp.AAC.5
MKLHYILGISLIQCRAFLFSPDGNRRKQIVLLLKSTENQNLALGAATDAITLHKQAEVLRAEAESLRKAIDESKAAARQKKIDDADRWINLLLVNRTIDESTQILNTEDQVAQILQDRRFSAEQVNQMFDRICETSSKQSIDRCSPLISLLLDAACMVDCMKREDNPNKRWNHRVERDLRKKLFAMGWGIDMDRIKEEEQDRNSGIGRFLKYHDSND